MKGSYTESEKAILKQRAQKLAPSAEQVEHRELLGTYVVIEAGPERFGIPSDSIKELVRAPPYVKLPLPKDWIVGICQVRGEIISIVDLTKWFGLSPLRARVPYLALITGPKGDIGFLFDEVIDVREVYYDELSTDMIEKTGSASKPFTGSTNDLVILVDMEEVFSSEDLIVDQLD